MFSKPNLRQLFTSLQMCRYVLLTAVLFFQAAESAAQPLRGLTSPVPLPRAQSPSRIPTPFQPPRSPKPRRSDIESPQRRPPLTLRYACV